MAKDDVIREWDRPPPPETVGKVTGQVAPHTHPEGLPRLGVRGCRSSDIPLDIADDDEMGSTEALTARIRQRVTGGGGTSRAARALTVAQDIRLISDATTPYIAATHSTLTFEGSADLGAGGILAGVYGEVTHNSSGDAPIQLAGVAAKATMTDGDGTASICGVYIDEPSITAGKCANSYGLYIDRQATSEATNKFAIQTQSGVVELNDRQQAGSDFIANSKSGQMFIVDAGADEVKLGDTAGSDYATFASDGELTLTGTARVTVDMYITASGVKAPGSKPATFIEQGLCGAWQFADAVLGNEESVSGTLKLPSQMDKTEVPVFKVGWSANGVSPGNCYWQLQYLYRSPGEDTTAAAQETLYATGTASSTSDGLVITSFSGVDLPSATDQAMFFKITRMSAHANDTIADTVELIGMLFTHTRDKLGTAT